MPKIIIPGSSWDSNPQDENTMVSPKIRSGGREFKEKYHGILSFVPADELHTRAKASEFC